MIVVIKYGGNAMAEVADSDGADHFATEIVRMHRDGLRPVVVHGGGPQISALMAASGLRSEFRDGLRVTDARTIDIVRTALVEHVSPRLVTAINNHGAPAVGVSGDTFLTAAPRDPELGFVGDVAAVDVAVLHSVIGRGAIPVVAPLGRDGLGQTYNINADTVAGALAAALAAHRLVYLTDIDGLRRVVNDATTRIGQITPDELHALLEAGTIANGMIPKVQSCIAAVRAGVAEAHIVDGRSPNVLQSVLRGEHIGTVVR